MQTLLQIAVFEIYCQFIVQFELLLGTMFGHGLKGERDAEKISLREIRVRFSPSDSTCNMVGDHVTVV